MSDFAVFSAKNRKSKNLASRRQSVWKKMNELSRAIAPHLEKFDPSLKVRKPSQWWLSARKPEGVGGIWLAFNDAALYYESAQYNMGVYRDGLHIGLEVPSKATPDRQRLAQFIKKRPQSFLVIVNRLRGSRAYVDCGGFSEYVYHVDRLDLERLLFEMKRAAWFTVAEQFVPRDRRPIGSRLLSFALRTFKTLQPLYTVAAGLDSQFETRATRLRLISQKDIAAREAWSMKVVLKFERNQGREPKDVSLLGEGYDIVSSEKNGKSRYIEVKSRLGGFPVELTDPEYRKARELRKNYYVYVLTGAHTSPDIHVIENPASSCEVVPVKSTSWIIKNWQVASKIMQA